GCWAWPEDIDGAKPADDEEEDRHHHDPHRCSRHLEPPDTRSLDRCTTVPLSRVPKKPPFSVGRELVRPELAPDFSDLVATFLTLRIGREQMILAAVREHLVGFHRGLLEEPDRDEISLVVLAQ